MTTMPLCHALRVLAETWTQDHPRVGFAVHRVNDVSPWSQNEQIEAWGAVRRAVGLPTEMRE